MLNKIVQRIEHSGPNMIIQKIFQRNLQTITTRSAYANNKLYFRSWLIESNNNRTKLSQSYNGIKPIPNTKINYIV